MVLNFLGLEMDIFLLGFLKINLHFFLLNLTFSLFDNFSIYNKTNLVVLGIYIKCN